MPSPATITDFEALPALLTARHLQDMLGCCQSHAHKILHSGVFPIIRIGKLVRVQKEDVRAWLNEQTIPAGRSN